MVLKNVFVQRGLVQLKHKLVGFGLKHHRHHHSNHHSHRGLGIPPPILISHRTPTQIKGLGVREMEHKLKRRPIKFMP